MITEIDALRETTKWFIRAKPSELTLTPYTREQLPNGGWRAVADTPRLPQVFRVIETTEPSNVTLDDGTQRTISYVLLGEHDAVVAKGDRFTYEDDPLEVVEINTFNGFEVRAFVVRLMDPPVTV